MNPAYAPTEYHSDCAEREAARQRYLDWLSKAISNIGDTVRPPRIKQTSVNTARNIGLTMAD